MRIKQLKEQRTKAHNEISAIRDTVVAANRPMTEEEKTKVKALEAQIASLDEEIQIEQRHLERERAWRPEAPDADQEAARRAAAAAGLPVEVGVDRRTLAPGYFGRQLHAIRRFYIAGTSEVGLSTEDRELLAPMRANGYSEDGFGVDQRRGAAYLAQAYALGGGPGRQAAATGANTDVPSEGGFLVGQLRQNEILQRRYAIGEILRRVDRLPIGAGFNGTKVPAIDETSRANGSRFGGIVSAWLGQGNEPASTGKPKFRDLDLKLRKVGAFVYSTDELNADAVAFEGWVNRNLPLELAFRTEDAIINGVGGTQPLGIMTGGALVTVTRSVASHVQGDDMRNLIARLWAPLRSGAVFLVDQSVEVDLGQLGIPIGTGGVLDPQYRPAGAMPGQVYATYGNIPIIPVEYCAALGTSGDIILVSLPDYLIIDKGAVESAVSLHVAFLSDQAVYRFIYRVDGQPTWYSALTPKSAGSTLSMAVVLS